MSEFQRPIQIVKGRGTVSRLASRFEAQSRTGWDDGWTQEEVGEALPPATTVRLEDCRSAITRNDSPDIHFDQAVNPYRGCEHGCIYCYARTTHSYLDLSPGLDFETKLVAKRNIAQVLQGELARPNYRPALINIGSATDCYQPIEREYRLTRAVIEVMAATRHPFSLVTKSSGVERDLDLIAPLAAQGLAAVYITVTTLDRSLARRLEPRAASPERRLRSIRTLAEAGVPVGVSLAPHIPFLTDDMEQVLEAARDAGARSAFYHVLRLPWEVSPLFRQWLEQHHPERAARVMARVQDMRGGKDYDSRFGSRFKGQGVWADLLRQRFAKACARMGLNRERLELDLTQFRAMVPGEEGQAELF
jgi:DNA repair photolyase